MIVYDFSAIAEWSSSRAGSVLVEKRGQFGCWRNGFSATQGVGRMAGLVRAWGAVVVASKGLGMTKGVDGAGCFGLRCFGVVRKARAGGRVPRRSAGNGIDPRAVGGRDGYVSLRQSFRLLTVASLLSRGMAISLVLWCPGYGWVPESERGCGGVGP